MDGWMGGSISEWVEGLKMNASLLSPPLPHTLESFVDVSLPVSGPRDTDSNTTLCCFSVPNGPVWVREADGHPLSPAAARPLCLPPLPGRADRCRVNCVQDTRTRFQVALTRGRLSGPQMFFICG